MPSDTPTVTPTETLTPTPTETTLPTVTARPTSGLPPVFEEDFDGIYIGGVDSDWESRNESWSEGVTYQARAGRIGSGSAQAIIATRGAGAIARKDVAVTPGKAYELHVWVRSRDASGVSAPSATGSWVAFGVDLNNRVTSDLGDSPPITLWDNSPSHQTGSGDWRLYSSAPFTADQATVSLWATAGSTDSSGITAAFDELSIVPSLFTPPTTVTCSWSNLAPLPEGRNGNSAGLAVLNNRILLTGGVDITTATGRWNASYDPVADAWTARAEYPRIQGRQGLNSNATLGNDVYFFGGYRVASVSTTQTVDIYNELTNQWRIDAATYPLAIGDVSTVNASDTLYCFGGGVASGTEVYSNAYKYVADTTSFVALTDMPTARAAARAFVKDDQIWVCGGLDATGTHQDLVEIYDPPTNTWVVGPDLPSVTSQLAWIGELDNGILCSVYFPETTGGSPLGFRYVSYTNPFGTKPVGDLLPNALGMYDVHGNVREWVEDDWHNDYIGAPTQTVAWLDSPSSATKVARGGSWNNVAQYVRTTSRVPMNQAAFNRNTGLRLVREVDSATPAAALSINIPGIAAGALALNMVYVTSGTFTMGSDDAEWALSYEQPAHSVACATAFYIGIYEVTQAQWEAVTGSNPSYFDGSGINNPVEMVSWDDCQAFITQLNTMGLGTFRLPTEAEWEYAARAGTTSHFSFGDSDCTVPGYCNSVCNLDNYAWWCGNNPAEDWWQPLCLSPVAQDEFAAAAIGNVIYLIGGEDGSGPVDTVQSLTVNP